MCNQMQVVEDAVKQQVYHFLNDYIIIICCDRALIYVTSWLLDQTWFSLCYQPGDYFCCDHFDCGSEQS